MLGLLLTFTGAAHGAINTGEDGDFTQVAAGDLHTVALRADGTVWTWGNDLSGQLGNDAALVDQPLPVQVAGLTNVREVAAGGFHTLALRADGTVWAWGWDSYGQLGNDAALVDQPTPVQVAGLTNVRHIAASAYHTVAVRADGTVWTWGSDINGQLGNDAALVDKPTPVQVVGLTNIREVAAGGFHTVALRADGTVWTWGIDSHGELGNDAAMVDRPTPVQVASLTNVRHVVAGGNWWGGPGHTVALKDDGTVWSWGWDGYGQLGNNAALVDQPLPVQVASLTNVREVAAGGFHTSALRTDGTVWTWGRDTTGQLGNDAALADMPTRVQVASLTGVRHIAAGGYHTVALRADGTIWAWGMDTYGELGDDAAIANKPTPVQANWSVECAFIQVAAGGYYLGGGSHTVALKADGTVWAWGRDGYGQLGDDTSIADKPTPVRVAGLTNIRQIAAGDYHTVALRADGTVWTWGSDGFGQLGDDATLADKATPVQVVGLANIREVSAGGFHTIAVRADGTVWTWGRDNRGQLGNDAVMVDRPTPVQVVSLTGIRHIAGGYGHTVALKGDGTVWTWGRDDWGQLGNDAALINQPTPVQVASLTGVHHIAAGYGHTIALRVDGTAWAWGGDSYGQLGDDAALVDKPTPVQVASLTNIRNVAGGFSHTAALRSDGTVWTWGRDGDGQLGDDAPLINQPTPVQVAGLASVRQVAVGPYHTVALRANGTVWTWGDDFSGQLGDDAALTDRPTPVIVADICETTPPNPNPTTGSGAADSPTQITWTIDPASDPIGLHTTPYSFDGGVAWQASNTLAQSGLSANTQYSVMIRARDSLDNRTTATTISRYTHANPPVAPAAVAGWNLIDGYNIALSWAAPAGGASSYVVRDVPGGVVQGTPGGTSFTSASLLANTAYTYKICSVNGDAVEEPTCSGSVSATTPPAAPTALATSNPTGTTVDVSWTAAAGQTDQRLEVFTDGGCTSSVSNTTGVASPYTITGLLLDHSYWYRISSFSTSSGAWGPATACTALSGNGRTTITLGLSSGSINFGTLLPGATGTGSITATVATYGSTGYTLAASIDGMLTSGGNTIPHTASGSIGSPPGAGAGPWVGSGFGITVSSATNLEAGWASGTRYAALTTTPTAIHDTGAAFTADTSNNTATVIDYRLTIPAAQPPGTYNATITYTATGTP